MTTTGLLNEKKLLIENATAQNVYDFLLLVIREHIPSAFERTRGAAIYHDILRVNADFPLRDGISITTHYYIEKPAGNVISNDHKLDFMSFKAVQVSNDRVMLYGGCTDHEEAKKALRKLWQIVVEAYSKPVRSPQSKVATAVPSGPGQAWNVIADNLGGTVSYTRNDQGQTILAGGTANPGYKFEIGSGGVAIKPEGAFWPNHTTGGLQPGWHSAEDKDEIVGSAGETPAGLSHSDAGQAEAENRRSLVKHGKSGRPHLPDDVWAWEQVNKLHRPTNDVKKEWLAKIKADPQRRNNVDLDRHFSKITKPNWGTKPD